MVVRVDGEGRFGADCLASGPLDHGTVVDATREPLQCQTHRSTHHADNLYLRKRGQLADRLDTETMQPISATGPIPHRRRTEKKSPCSRVVSWSREPPGPRRFSHPGRDLGDLLTRARPHRRDQAGLDGPARPQLLAKLRRRRSTLAPASSAAPRTLRRTTAVPGSGPHHGQCQLPGGSLPNRPRRGAAAPPRRARPDDGPDASASPTGHQKPARPHNGAATTPRPPRPRPEPAGRAGGRVSYRRTPKNASMSKCRTHRCVAICLNQCRVWG